MCICGVLQSAEEKKKAMTTSNPVQSLQGVVDRGAHHTNTRTITVILESTARTLEALKPLQWHGR